MNSIKELPDLFVELLEAVDTRTGIPKFPKRATELVREISAWAKTTRFYADHAQEARGFWEAGAEPEEIWLPSMSELGQISSYNPNRRPFTTGGYWWLRQSYTAGIYAPQYGAAIPEEHRRLDPYLDSSFLRIRENGEEGTPHE